RVDDDDLTAGVLRLAQVRHEVRRGADGVVAPDNDELAVDDVGVWLAPAQAERPLDGVLGRGAADGALQAAGAEAVPEHRAGYRHLHQPERAAVAVRQDRLRPPALADRPPAPADLVQRLVPGDSLPPSGTFRPDAAQRVQEAVGVVDVIEVRPHLGAQPAAGDGVVGVAGEADGAAVLHLGDDAAGVGAVVWAGAAEAGGRGH